jgi:hypothetical protein
MGRFQAEHRHDGESRSTAVLERVALANLVAQGVAYNL